MKRRLDPAKWLYSVFGFLMLPYCSWSIENGLARTPPMGWNSWNHFKGAITEAKFKAIADAFVSSGLKDAGYNYLVIDDGWMEAERDVNANLIPVASKFPNGMKTLGDYAHTQGLKFGIYACPTKTTCMRRAGSFDHEIQDAKAFALWGVDFLKYDWCGVQSGEDANGGVPVPEVMRRYVSMRNALQATKRPILYGLCEKGQGTRGIEPGSWQDTVGNMWRIGYDIHPDWTSILSHIDEDASLSQLARPGGWNDPDMMEVGNFPSQAENRAHFSLWCILAAPLIMGNDPSTMTDSIKAILANKEAIAVDQDSLGMQGVRIKGKGALEVWVKTLKNQEKAVVLFNRTAAAAKISVLWTDSLIKWEANAKVDVRDLWLHQDSLTVSQGLSAYVPAHDVAMFRLRNRAVSTAFASKSWRQVIKTQGRNGGLDFFMPTDANTGKAELIDLQGHLVFGMKVSRGWNTIQLKASSSAIYLFRVSYANKIITRPVYIED
jgi:alpha-galactosidase